MSGSLSAAWLSPRDLRADAAMRLFCLPHAGAGAAGFYRWKRQLGDVDVCPILLPGREVRLAEPAMSDAGVLIAALVDAIAAHLDVPYAIFGHSMGALLAYELAVRVEAAGLRAPVCLFVSGRNAPQTFPGYCDLHGLQDDAFIAALERLYGSAEGELLADPELRQVFLPILRADLTLVERYGRNSWPALQCPVVALAGVDDPSVTEDGLAAWSALSSASFELHRLPGDHFYHFGQGQPRLLETISGHLAHR